MGIEVYRGRGSNVAKEAVRHSAGRYSGASDERPTKDVHFNTSPKQRRADGSDYKTDADNEYFRNLKMVPPAGRKTRP